MPFLRSACRLPALLGFALVLSPLRPGAQTSRTDLWVGTWAAAPSAGEVREGTLPETATLREIVHTTRGGAALRVTLSNELGTDPLTVSGAHVALRAQESGLMPGTDHALSFGGQGAVVIPAGAVAVSDPVAMAVPALRDLAISLLLPAQPLHTITSHSLALQTNYRLAGDHLADASLDAATKVDHWLFLKNVEVSSPGAKSKNAGAIVTLGDSITDGFRSTTDTNRRWPDVLAQRLQADKKLNGLGVLNEGISGNRLLHNGAGPNALARLDRDVLSQSGVKYLIVMEGINDIGGSAKPRTPQDAIMAADVIQAYGQIVERAHAHGIKVYGATLTPFTGAGYATPAGETMRQTANAWIRAAGHFDGVIDFDRATRDAARPETFSSAADSGDHLHPGDDGYRSMGESIDLTLFKP